MRMKQTNSTMVLDHTIIAFPLDEDEMDGTHVFDIVGEPQNISKEIVPDWVNARIHFAWLLILVPLLSLKIFQKDLI